MSSKPNNQYLSITEDFQIKEMVVESESAIKQKEYENGHRAGSPIPIESVFVIGNPNDERDPLEIKEEIIENCADAFQSNTKSKSRQLEKEREIEEQNLQRPSAKEVSIGDTPNNMEVSTARRKQSKKLQIKLTRASDNIPFKCEVCGKTFKRKYELNRHMSVHRKVRFFFIIKTFPVLARTTLFLTFSMKLLHEA